MATVFPQCSHSPFSFFAAQYLAALSVFNPEAKPVQFQISNHTTSDKNPKPATRAHLVGFYETYERREEHGRLRGFGVLSEILHHRAVSILERRHVCEHVIRCCSGLCVSLVSNCGLTCAFLLSLVKDSSCSQFVLMNSFNTGLSSCTRNSFLVISIPRSKQRIS